MDRRDEISRDSGLARSLESPAAAATATPKLDTVDFVSEERLWLLKTWSTRKVTS